LNGRIIVLEDDKLQSKEENILLNGRIIILEDTIEWKNSIRRRY
jgi:hypothetical protein